MVKNSRRSKFPVEYSYFSCSENYMMGFDEQLQSIFVGGDSARDSV